MYPNGQNITAGKIDEWDDVLGNIDELCALASFTFCNPGYVFPAIDREGKVIIEAKQLGHPLIARDRCVCNDVSAMTAGNFMIVTGANMAGKSTYLRTVGVNLSVGACWEHRCLPLKWW